MGNRDLVVIGGSAGAAAPLRTNFALLPADLPATVAVVLHVPAGSTGVETMRAAVLRSLKRSPASIGDRAAGMEMLGAEASSEPSESGENSS